MKRLCTIWIGFGSLLLLTGCSMCGSEWLEAYPAYGGRWQRDDRFYGRVGSQFENVGHRVEDGESAEPEPAEMYEEIAPPAIPQNDTLQTGY